LRVIEYLPTHAIEKLSEAGVRSATFGAGSTARLDRTDNVGGFHVMALENAYNGSTHTFPSFSAKADFRAKSGTHPELACLLPVLKSNFLG